MRTVITQSGKQIELISAHDLRSPRDSGMYVRAFCHIHGGDHQRSLSVHRASGWGRCFNASCRVQVLVMEWGPDIAERLIQSMHTNAEEARVESIPSLPTRRHKWPLHQLALPYPPIIPQWQQDELASLHRLAHQAQHSYGHVRRARAYLQARGIAPQTAQASGLIYLPLALVKQQEPSQQQLMQRWPQRFLFPLRSPMGHGYIGRTIWGWRPGMSEKQHKALLERTDKQRRWIKTNPAGWFCCDFRHFAEHLIMVEGGFDRLTLLQAGFHAEEVVALAGTNAPAHWLPPQVRSIILALDGDQGGHEAARHLAEQFTAQGITTHICLPPDDQLGKDWNERWQRRRRAGLRPIIELYHSLHHRRPTHKSTLQVS